MGHLTASMAILCLCLTLSAYFSATETAFSSLSRIRIKNMADKGNQRAALVLGLIENYDALLSTILIGNNIVNIAGASIATLLCVRWLAEDAGPTAATAVTTIVVLIFGEVTPKSIAKESPEAFAMASAPLLRFLAAVFAPFNALFGCWKQCLSKILKPKEEHGITEEELLALAEEAKEDGEIDEQENMLIRRALKFSEQTAADIFTPRIDITAVPVGITKEELAAVFADTAYSRLPVFEGDIDHIIGIVYQKDFCNHAYPSGQELRDIIRPALFVPKSQNIGVLLKELQRKKVHIAVVLDEYGGTAGLLTLEDILEELVGEIWDEYDEASAALEKKSDTEYLVSGKADVGKVFEDLGIAAPGGGAPSGIVNRWIIHMLGKIPEKGDSFRCQGYKITVVSVSRHRVEQVLFQKD